MSPITKEFTKEQLQQIIETDHVQCGEASALARIALASLEAEPVAWLLSGGGAKNHVSFDSGNAYADPLREVTPLYTAPPAPVSVPDEVCWEDVPEEITEDDMALASAWAHGFNQCRAAMLKHSEPFIVTSDHRMMEMPQVEAINAVTAMLHGGNHTEQHLEMVDHSGDPTEKVIMLQGAENAETPTTMQTAPALDSSPKIAGSPSSNSPVIPDGWVMVPEEPTHEMLEAGDEQFGTYDVYRRMIEAAPKLE